MTTARIFNTKQIISYLATICQDNRQLGGAGVQMQIDGRNFIDGPGIATILEVIEDGRVFNAFFWPIDNPGEIWLAKLFDDPGKDIVELKHSLDESVPDKGLVGRMGADGGSVKGNHHGMKEDLRIDRHKW